MATSSVFECKTAQQCVILMQIVLRLGHNGKSMIWVHDMTPVVKVSFLIISTKRRQHPFCMHNDSPPVCEKLKDANNTSKTEAGTTKHGHWLPRGPWSAEHFPFVPRV